MGSQKLTVGPLGTMQWRIEQPEGSRQNAHRSFGLFGNKSSKRLKIAFWCIKALWKFFDELHINIQEANIKRSKPRRIGSQEDHVRVEQPTQYRVHAGLIRKFGDEMSQLIHDWWQGTGKIFLQRTGPLQWISFSQLFADFQMTMCVQGPVFFGQKWVSSPSVFPADQQPTWGRHARWFQLLLKDYWKFNKLHLHVKSGPPESAILQCWMVNVRLLWDANRLRIVDEAMRKQTDGCIRVGKLIHQFAHFPRHSEMGVLRWFSPENAHMARITGHVWSDKIEDKIGFKRVLLLPLSAKMIQFEIILFNWVIQPPTSVVYTPELKPAEPNLPHFRTLSDLLTSSTLGFNHVIYFLRKPTKNTLQASFKKIDPEQLDRLATGARWRFRLASGGGGKTVGFWCIWGWTLKWWVSPTNPWVFLLKMISTWGGEWELPPFKETPISPSGFPKPFNVSIQPDFIVSQRSIWVAPQTGLL